MTNLVSASIKPGLIYFYSQDPVQHGALLVCAAGERVTAFSSAKAMKLDYCAQDLIGPDALATQAKGILERKDHEDWQAMVAGRLDALAAGIKLQEDKDINLAVRIEQLSAVIKDRLASTANALNCQPQVPEAACCHKCADDKTAGRHPLSSNRMILCPDCQNKRCPRASDHELACTGCNDSGLPGSLFEKHHLPTTPAEAKALLGAIVMDAANP